MYKWLCLTLILICISCDSFVTFSCSSEGDGFSATTIDGGGFDQYKLPTQTGNCSEPFYSYNFHCGPSSCFGGCQITFAKSGQDDQNFCDTSDNGTLVISVLDQYYRQYLPTLNQTVTNTTSYNWCDCGINHAILVGISVGAIIVLSCCCCCVGWCMAICRKRSSLKESN